MKVVLFLWGGCLAAGLSLAAMAAPITSSKTMSNNPYDVVFRIGTFDRSSVEFAGGVPSQPVDYVVGKSHAEKDWYATQPAEIEGEAEKAPGNSQTAPRAIGFSVIGVPAQAYRLHVAVLTGSGQVFALRVRINGKQGMFYLHLTNAHADVAFSFPGSYLHEGRNRITLQVIGRAEPGVPVAALLDYDAIELDRDRKSWSEKVSSAQIEPTIFYPQGPGPLREVVNVFIRYREPVKPGSPVELNLSRQHYHQALRGNQDFGEEKLDFPVAEFPAKTRAQLAWSVARHRQHSEERIDPKKRWTLLLVPHVHLDIGFTDNQATVAAIQSRVIDEAMELTAEHPDFRFSLDGYWPLEQFLKSRAPTQQQRAITAIQKRQLFVPADYVNLLTGFPTAETLIRSLYASANFSRIHGTPFNYATITDVPSYSWSYASILASAGIKDLLGGSNNYRAPVLLQGHLNEASPMWWEGPDGQKVLFWYSFAYMQMQVLFGLPPLPETGHDTLPLFLQPYEHPGYRANAVILYGSQAENTNLFPQQAELAQQWNSVYAYPHLQYSGFHDALENIARQFGNNIPTVRGDGGPYWEDGIAADAYYAAVERQNEARGPSAEKLTTLTSLVNPLLVADKADLDRMWTNMLLMDEHTWGSYDSVTDPTSMEAVQQLALKDQYPIKAQGLADFLARTSMTSIANSIPTDPAALVIFNTLNWKRSGPVSIDLHNGYEVVDKSTGQIVPVEVLHSGNSFRHVRFIAQDIPAVGYKVFQLRPAKKTPAFPETTHTTTLESPYYRVTLDPSTGAVRSIYDKQLQRELVNSQSPYRFGQYLYVTGGDRVPNAILQYGVGFPKPKLEIHPSHDGKLISVTRTPYGWVARMESTDTNTPGIATEIRLFDKEKKIEFIEDVDKEKVYSKEAVYFAFPFAMKQPQFQYEIQTGVVDPAKDMYAGAGHEWFSVQHWVSVQQDGMSTTVMPLDASLVTLGDINRGAWPTQFGQRPGTIFSYVMNNYWDTNFAAGQGGNFRFRYIVTSAPATHAAELSRMGWEEATPLEVDEGASQGKAPLDGKQESFLKVNDSKLLLDTWKPAEDGKGTILRFLDLGGTMRTVTVQTPLLQLSQAVQTDSVERNRRPLPLVGGNGFEFTIHPREIVTVRIVGKDAMQAPLQ